MSFPLKTLSALALCGFALNAYSFNPGTCTIVKPGIGGDVPVTVTFSKDRIEAITIGENNETPGIGKVAIEQLPPVIIEEQSVGVNGLSGASITSGAILAAVSECIVQAGGDLEKMKVVKAKGPAEAKSLETDVIIVGAGAAGQAATIRASELGKNVILLEKQPFAGGAAAVNGGTVVTQGSNLQKEMGSTNDSNELMTQDYLDNGHNLNDRRMLKLYVENVGPTVDWAISNAGMHVNKEAGFTNEAEHSVPRVVRWIDGSQGATRDLKAAVAKSGAQVLLGTPAQSLIYEDGKVVGVKAKAADGTEYTIRAPVTILTTGGFGANKDMLQGNLKNTLYYGVKSSNGEGHKMAMDIGAKTQMMDLGKVYPNGIEVAPGIAKSTIWSNKAAFEDNSGIMVNKAGKRVINELDTNHHITEALGKEGNVLYILMDQKTFDAFLTKLDITGITKQDIENWLANEGKSAPIVVKGQTIEEVAQKAGVDGQQLAETAKQYNEYVKAGKDTEFNRPAQFMKNEIDVEGPFYIVEQKPRFATTMGGLVTDETLNVVNQNGEPIPGLFAAGELVGGSMGDDSPPGGNMAWALTSGKLAAEAATKAAQ